MSRYASRKSIDLEWMERWARSVNEDRILPVVGRFFNGRFVIGVDDTDYLVEVRNGRIQRLAEGLASNDFGYEFAFRASASSWAKFAQPVPPPMFNDLWAMAHPLHKNLVIEGNTMPFWQNMRAIHRMFLLMRNV